MKKKVTDYIYGTIPRFMSFKVTGHAAQSAFFLLMSFIPFLMFLISIIRFMSWDETILIELFRRYVPQFAEDAVTVLIEELYSHSIGILSFSAVCALWSAAKSVQGITYGLNCVREIPEKRNYFYLRFQAMIETFALLLSLFFIVVFIVYGSEIRSFIHFIYKFDETPVAVTFFMTVRFLLAFALFVMLFTTAFTVLPNQKTSFKEQLASGFFCAVAWMIFTNFLAVYVKFFNGFSIYGSMVAVLLIMLWLYTGMIIFFVCAMVTPMINYMIKYGWTYKVLHKDPTLIPVPLHVEKVMAEGRRFKEEYKKVSD
ncbi:MAG: YihY/virulence factor BrkB family protein [Eubacterium sp.]|nr:YihY/virulence factor BrkB family protein [Eubacterium sp.]